MGITFGNIWVSGFHLYLGGPKTYRSVPWSSIEPWKGLLQAVDDQIVFHPGQELWSLSKYYLLVAGGWIGGWLYLLGKRWFSRRFTRDKRGNIMAEAYLGGGNSNIFGIFIPNLGEDEPIVSNTFQMGWNHQPDIFDARLFERTFGTHPEQPLRLQPTIRAGFIIGLAELFVQCAISGCVVTFLGFELLTSSPCVFQVKDYSFLTITMSGIGTFRTFPTKKAVFFFRTSFLGGSVEAIRFSFPGVGPWSGRFCWGGRLGRGDHSTWHSLECLTYVTSRVFR